MLVVYGPTAGLSVGKLFYGAMIPGILLGLLYIVYVLVKCYFNPAKNEEGIANAKKLAGSFIIENFKQAEELGAKKVLFFSVQPASPVIVIINT